MINKKSLLKLYGYKKVCDEELLTIWVKNNTHIPDTDIQQLKVKELMELLRKKECELISYKGDIPILKPIKTDHIHFYILCPYCGEVHKHGVADGEGGHRLSHCFEAKPNDHGYYIKP